MSKVFTPVVKLFGGGEKSEPTPAPTPAPAAAPAAAPAPAAVNPTNDRAAADKLAEDERQRRQASGRASNVLTGGTGVGDDADIIKKKLTGSA